VAVVAYVGTMNDSSGMVAMDLRSVASPVVPAGTEGGRQPAVVPSGTTCASQ
jgi:hypothetical protein